MELSQLKSLEPQLSEDSPLENFVRLTEDATRPTRCNWVAAERGESPWKSHGNRMKIPWLDGK